MVHPWDENTCLVAKYSGIVEFTDVDDTKAERADHSRLEKWFVGTKNLQGWNCARQIGLVRLSNNVDARFSTCRHTIQTNSTLENLTFVLDLFPFNCFHDPISKWLSNDCLENNFKRSCVLAFSNIPVVTVRTRGSDESRGLLLCGPIQKHFQSKKHFAR